MAGVSQDCFHQRYQRPKNCKSNVVVLMPNLSEKQQIQFDNNNFEQKSEMTSQAIHFTENTV